LVALRVDNACGLEKPAAGVCAAWANPEAICGTPPIHHGRRPEQALTQRLTANSSKKNPWPAEHRKVIKRQVRAKIFSTPEKTSLNSI
jgi:hypothetical protein